MALPRRARTVCDGCGNGMARAAILHAGKAYCKLCRKKHFRAVPCDGCGNLTSSYHGEQPARCKICRSKNRKCLRCGEGVVNKGEKGRKIGITLPEGVVCSSCRDHYREERACAACGRMSRFLSRDIKVGFTEPVCSTCRHRSRPFVWCARCGNYRYEFGEIGEQKVCFSCYREERPFACPGCGKPGIMYENAPCAECNWKGIVRSEAGKTADGLRNAWCRSLYLDFSEDLIATLGGYDAKERFPLYTPFFTALDCSFSSPDDIDIPGLCRIIPANELRRYKISYEFLVKKGILPDDLNTRDDEYEAIRQQALLADAKGKWFAHALQEFHEHMMKVRLRFQRRGWKGKYVRFRMVNITKSLAAASQFLESSKIVGLGQLTPDHLDEFFYCHKNHKYSLYGFIRFLRKKGRSFVALDLRGLAKPVNYNFIPEQICEKLIDKWLNCGDGDIKQSLVCILMLFYAQRAKRLACLELSDVCIGEKGGCSIAFVNDDVKLAPEISELLKRYLDQRGNEDRENKYLFPGLTPGSHISVRTLKEYPAKYGVTNLKLFATGLARLGQYGLRYPNAITRTLGVSTFTAVRYLSIFNERIRDEMRKAL